MRFYALIRIALIILWIGLFPYESEGYSFKKGRISLDFEKADILDVLDYFADVCKPIGIIMHPDVYGTVTLLQKNLSCEEALKTIVSHCNLRFEYGGENIVRIYPPNYSEQSDFFTTNLVVYAPPLPVYMPISLENANCYHNGTRLPNVTILALIREMLMYPQNIGEKISPNMSVSPYCHTTVRIGKQQYQVDLYLGGMARISLNDGTHAILRWNFNELSSHAKHNSKTE